MISGETIISYDDLDIDLQDIYIALGYGKNVPEELVRESIQEVIDVIAPQVRSCYYFDTFEGHLSKESLTIGKIEFCIGKIISSQMKKSEKFVLFAATAGMEFENYLEEIKEEGDIFRLYIADALGSIIVERTADKLEQHLFSLISPGGYRHTNRFSPGYCGWLVNEQQKLFSFLPAQVCNISLMESSLMYPVKSVSGVIGIGLDVSKKEYTCNICNYKNCYKRYSGE